MKKCIVLCVVVLLSAAACKKDERASRHEAQLIVAPSKEKNVSIKDSASKQASLKGVSAKKASLVSFKGRVIDVTPEYVVVKRFSVEKRYYFDSQSVVYDVRGDIGEKENLWINHVVEVKFVVKGGRKIVKSLQVISEMDL